MIITLCFCSILLQEIMAGCEMKKSFKWTTAWPMEENYVTYKLVGPLDESANCLTQRNGNFNLQKFLDNESKYGLELSTSKIGARKNNTSSIPLKSGSLAKISRNLSKFISDAELDECLSNKMERFNDNPDSNNAVVSSMTYGSFPQARIASKSVSHPDSKNSNRTSMATDLNMSKSKSCLNSNRALTADSNSLTKSEFNSYSLVSPVKKMSPVISINPQGYKEPMMESYSPRKAQVGFESFPGTKSNVKDASFIAVGDPKENTINSVCRSSKTWRGQKRKEDVRPYSPLSNSRGRPQQLRASLQRQREERLKGFRPKVEHSKRCKQPKKLSSPSIGGYRNKIGGGGQPSSWFTDLAPWFKTYGSLKSESVGSLEPFGLNDLTDNKNKEGERH